MKTSNFLKNAGDTPAALLRQLASRAYRVLRTDRPVDRFELLGIVDEIERSRRVFAPVAHTELMNWFDRLEDQVVRRLDGGHADAELPSTEPTACHGVGVA